LLYPGATNLGTIELYNVPYNHYLKFMFKFALPLLLAAAVLLSLAAAIGFVF